MGDAVLPLQHAQGQSCFAVGRSLCAPGHTCGHTRTHPRAHPGTRGFSRSQDEPCALTEVPDCHCGLALGSGAHRSQAGHYTVVGAGTVEGMGCRLGAPEPCLQKCRSRFRVLTFRAQPCLGKPPCRPQEVRLRPGGSGSSLRPGLGDRPTVRSHRSTTTRAPALRLALWPSDVESSGPRRAEGRMDLTVPSAQHRPGPPHSSPRSCLFP